MFDINTHIPAFVHITPSSVHDMNAMDTLFYENGAYYIFDRGYVDYTRLYKITQHSATFVVRVKSNRKFNRMYSRKHDKSTGVNLIKSASFLAFMSRNNIPKSYERLSSTIRIQIEALFS